MNTDVTVGNLQLLKWYYVKANMEGFCRDHHNYSMSHNTCIQSNMPLTTYTVSKNES